MKAVVLFCAVVAAIAPASVVNAQQGQNCDQIVQNLNNSATAISNDATSYWGHRANFVAIVYPNNQNGQGQNQNGQGQNQNGQGQNDNAQGEEDQANAIKAGVPGKVNTFKGFAAQAQDQNCLSPTQLSAIVEPTIKSGKRVNFDRFPPKEAPFLQESSPGPRRLP
jgi:hypothetical protein